jgi:hypothetical protein
MGIFINLSSLPELQRLDKRRRSRALLDWRIELWRGWAIYFIELGIFVSVLAFFRVVWHVIIGSVHWPWYADLIWIIPGSFTALALRNHLLYLRRRDVLAKILERPEYAV